MPSDNQDSQAIASATLLLTASSTETRSTLGTLGDPRLPIMHGGSWRIAVPARASHRSDTSRWTSLNPQASHGDLVKIVTFDSIGNGF